MSQIQKKYANIILQQRINPSIWTNKNIFSDKKPTAADINIYTVKIRDGKPMKVIKMTLAHIWKQGYRIRINNFGDRESTAHTEKDIRNQVGCIFLFLTNNLLKLTWKLNTFSMNNTQFQGMKYFRIFTLKFQKFWNLRLFLI